MRFILRRSLTTIVPPKVASPLGIGAPKDQARVAWLGEFYGKLPKGPPPARKPSGLFEWYQDRYFTNGRESPAPLGHIIAFFLITGYAQEYYFHLRHRKNNAH